VFTCAHCYRDPDVRGARERLFRPELAAAAQPAGTGRGGTRRGRA